MCWVSWAPLCTAIIDTLHLTFIWIFLDHSLRSTETSFQLNKELAENCQKLQQTEDRLYQAKKEIKKVRVF